VAGEEVQVNNIIVDLDGTLALDAVRAKKHLHIPCYHHDSQEDANCPVCKGAGKWHRWDEYFAECDSDALCYPVYRILQGLWRDHKIYILSGRSDVVRDKTVAWLNQHSIRYDQLVMRGADNREQDNVLKIRWAKELGLTPENTLFVLEDRARVVEAWRSAGYVCLQVAPGNF
jgi:hypothetical protein